MAAQAGVLIPLEGINEKLVARLWDDQRPFVLPMATLDGQPFQVVYRGRRRWDRGPDFPNALIAWANGRLSSGDVEVHVHASDWYAHRHHLDPHYNGVILHVVLWGSAGGPTVRQDGQTVPVVSLALYLSASLEGLMLSPASDLPAPVPCWDDGKEDKESEVKLGAILEQYGEKRLAAKAAVFESDLTCRPADQLLYRAIAVALGYSQNRRPFGRLAELLPVDSLAALHSTTGEGALGLEALLMGTAGLLPSQRGMDSPVDDPHSAALELAWEAGGRGGVDDPMEAREWEFFRVRPANFPTRRLGALAWLVSRWPPEGMAERLAALATSVEPKALPRAMEGVLLGADREGYWSRHCDFGLPLRRRAEPIGRQRAAEVAVNAFLPFLVAQAASTDDAGLAERVHRAYLLYPKRGDNELTRYTAHQITGAARPRVARSACRQQGLLGIYREFCERKRCAECPCRIDLTERGG